MEPIIVVKAIGAAKGMLFSHEKSGNIFIKLLIGFASFIAVLGGLLGMSLSCFSGSSLDDSFDPTATEGYQLCQEVYAEYLEWLEEEMDAAQERIIREHTYTVSWTEKHWENGSLTEETVEQDRCDIQVVRKVNEISFAYMMSYLSTTTSFTNDSTLSEQINREQLLVYLKRISPLMQSLAVENKITLFNTLRGIDEIGEALFPNQPDQQNQMIFSFDLYVSFLGEKGIVRDFVEGFDSLAEGLIHPTGMPVPHYFQSDYRNVPYGSGSIASSGCAPTCIAMAASYFSGETITPADVAKTVGNQYYVPGTGSSWSIFTGSAAVLGMSCTNLGKSADKVISEISAGHPVIASMGKGTFTKGGHFIVLRGITQNGSFLVNDPNRSNYNLYGTDEFQMKLVFQEAKNFWSFQERQN